MTKKLDKAQFMRASKNLITKKLDKAQFMRASKNLSGRVVVVNTVVN